MNKKTVMMIGGGIQEFKALDIIKRSGYNSLVTDINPNSPCKEEADFFINIDGRDIESLISYSLKHQEKLNIAGVFTLTEMVSSVAAVANACGLPGVSIKSSVMCQDKELSQRMWKESGIDSPEGKVINTQKDALELLEFFGGCMFIKPTIGFGSIGAQRINSQIQLEEYFQDALGPFLVEEFLEGSMHDVNGVFDIDGNFHPLGIVDRKFLEDFPVESESRAPTALNEDHKNDLYDLLRKSTKALGISWGPVKGDAVLTDNGFKILEVAPRVHGPKSSVYILPLSGADCLGSALSVIAGDQLQEHVVDCHKHIICRGLFPEKGTKMNDINLNKIMSKEGIVDIISLKNKDSIISDYKNSTDVPGYIFSSGGSFKECEKYLEFLEEENLNFELN